MNESNGYKINSYLAQETLSKASALLFGPLHSFSTLRAKKTGGKRKSLMFPFSMSETLLESRPLTVLEHAEESDDDQQVDVFHHHGFHGHWEGCCQADAEAERLFPQSLMPIYTSHLLPPLM